jgi:hypothetical protein
MRITLNERGSAIMLFIVPLIMMYFIGSVNFNSYNTPTIDIVRSAQPDEFGDKLVALLRAEGKKKLLGQDRFLFCDLSRPAEQPEACKLAEAKVNESIVALSANRLKEGTLAAIVIGELHRRPARREERGAHPQLAEVAQRNADDPPGRRCC